MCHTLHFFFARVYVYFICLHPEFLVSVFIHFHLVHCYKWFAVCKFEKSLFFSGVYCVACSQFSKQIRFQFVCCLYVGFGMHERVCVIFYYVRLTWVGMMHLSDVLFVAWHRMTLIVTVMTFIQFSPLDLQLMENNKM